MIDDIAMARSLRQLREDYLNAIEVEDDVIEVPAAFVGEILERLAKAQEDRDWLGYLDQAGIDNSTAYDYACQLRREARAAVPSGTEEANDSE